MIYRVKQFIQGLLARITNKDKAFINRYLSEQEQEIFFSLRKSEQYHSLKVAYACYKCMPENKSLVRVALLHDIGKIGSNLNLINKSLVVMSIKFKIDYQKLPKFLQKAIDYKENHPQIGYQLLKAYPIADCELSLIKNHHNFFKNQTEEMKILQYYDNRY